MNKMTQWGSITCTKNNRTQSNEIKSLTAL